MTSSLLLILCSALLIPFNLIPAMPPSIQVEMYQVSDYQYRGPGTGIGGGPSGTALVAQNDESPLATYDWTYVAVFDNDTYPDGTTVSWHNGEYGSVELTTCTAPRGCLAYHPYEGYEPARDQFSYTLLAPDNSSSDATAFLYTS